jgi:hypothetical protein
MPKSDQVVAVLCSDIHLSLKPPSLRADEPDWFEAMSRPLKEIRDLQKRFKVPVICAGDIFDHWKSLPELINFAIQELPTMYAVPGQHDLPNHSYEDIEKSAYWTLVEAGRVSHIEPGHPVEVGDLELHGFPWGFGLKKPNSPNESLTKIAVVHQYVWTGTSKYPAATKETHVSASNKYGYDVSVFGDNHIGFIKGSLCNCGGLMRRAVPDLYHKPFVGVLTADGVIKKHLIDTSNDIYCDSEDIINKTQLVDVGKFTESLLGLRDSKDDLNFGQVLQRYCRKNKVSSRVSNIINAAVESER